MSGSYESIRLLEPIVLIGGSRWILRGFHAKVRTGLKNAACLLGVNWLLICEGRAFILLKHGGVIFGTTILGKESKRNFLAKTLMQVYNSKRIFANLEDNADDLESVLKANFRDSSIRVIGCVAFFVGRT